MVFFLLSFGDYSWNNEIQLPPTHSTKVLGLAVEMILGKWIWFYITNANGIGSVSSGCGVSWTTQINSVKGHGDSVWSGTMKSTKKECCFCMVMGQ